MLTQLTAAVLVLTLLAPTFALADAGGAGAIPAAVPERTGQPVFNAEVPPPAKATDLVWRFRDTSTEGVWLTKEHEQTVGTKILKCTAAFNTAIDKVGACELALATERGQAKVQGLDWRIVGGVGIVLGLAVGLATGYLINRQPAQP